MFYWARKKTNGAWHTSPSKWLQRKPETSQLPFGQLFMPRFSNTLLGQAQETNENWKNCILHFSMNFSSVLMAVREKRGRLLISTLGYTFELFFVTLSFCKSWKCYLSSLFLRTKLELTEIKFCVWLSNISRLHFNQYIYIIMQK